MNGLRTKLALEAHLRMLSQLPVRTHLRPEKKEMRGSNVSHVKASEAGKKARKMWK